MNGPRGEQCYWAVNLLFACSVLAAQAAQPTPNCPRAQYDESKVPKWTLPDPLILLNGKKGKDAKRLDEEATAGRRECRGR
jgi:hypothetical protein